MNDDDDITIIGNPVTGFRAFLNGSPVDYNLIFCELEKERINLKEIVNNARCISYGDDN